MNNDVQERLAPASLDDSFYAPAGSDDTFTIQGCDKTLFRNAGSLRADACAQKLRDNTNKSGADYAVWNPRDVQCDSERAETLKNVASCHPNLHYRDGEGNVDACNVDNDTMLRTSSYADDRRRHQLFPREFKANPGFAHGDFLPEIDSALTRGAVQQREKRAKNSGEDCDHVSEGDRMQNFIPMIGCLASSVQDPRHIVPNWTNGGLPSRMVVKSDAFAAGCYPGVLSR
jgi:hypothetical protein